VTFCSSWGIFKPINITSACRGWNRRRRPGVEAPQPGFLLCQDTYLVGSIKSVGKIYMQSVVDAHCARGFATLYLSKLPITAVDVLPFG
jgi:hypothetical protein